MDFSSICLGISLLILSFVKYILFSIHFHDMVCVCLKKYSNVCTICVKTLLLLNKVHLAVRVTECLFIS